MNLEEGSENSISRRLGNGSVEPYSLSSAVSESVNLIWELASMIDNPEKTTRLLAALKAAAPFEVELAPPVVKQLRADKVAAADQSRQVVSDVSYLGDEGGIMCHIAPPESESAIVISLTQVRVPRTMPLSASVFDYQKHRVKKLKKQGGW
jgi:hypothetical protein